MSGDRLAQIERRLRACAEDVKEGRYYHPIAVGWYADDVLALVEVAKAAQPMADLPWPLSADERQEWIVKQNLLRSALARLGSGAAE